MITAHIERINQVDPAVNAIVVTDDSGMVYYIDTPYAPDAAGGLRYDDPDVGIAWPAAPVVISERDSAWPGLGELFQ